MTLEYQNPVEAARRRQHRLWKRALAWGVGGLVFGAIVIIYSLPTLGRAREPANRYKCASSLKQIGQAAMTYASEHGGAFPTDLLVLFAYWDFPSEIFVCPSTDTDRAMGTTQDEIIKQMSSGNHVSYVWTGAGLNNKSPADAVLAFDLEMHVPRDYVTTTGMNVLFTNGTVTFVDQRTAENLRAQFAAGIRPIRLPAAQPPTGSQGR